MKFNKEDEVFQINVFIYIIGKEVEYVFKVFIFVEGDENKCICKGY